MVIMERINQARQLCTLLQKMLLSFIKKDKEHRVTLQWLEKFFKRHAECCFSWMHNGRTQSNGSPPERAIPGFVTISNGIFKMRPSRIYGNPSTSITTYKIIN